MNIPIGNVAGRIAEPVAHANPAPVSQPRAAAAPSTPTVGTAKPDAGHEVTRSETARRDELESELAAANQKLASDGHEMRFEYDRDAARLVVRLVDSGTQEVLRQFPSEDALRAARQIKSGKSLINMRA
ncbi:MAG: flagellar protein FlaG [Usitatibacteraceae bacterium]